MATTTAYMSDAPSAASASAAATNSCKTDPPTPGESLLQLLQSLILQPVFPLLLQLTC